MEELEEIKQEFYLNPNYDDKLFYNDYIKALEARVASLNAALTISQLNYSLLIGNIK